MALISQIIDDALVELGVKSPIEQATPQDHSYGLRALNDIIETLNLENLTISYLQEVIYTGTGGDPVFVMHDGSYVVSGGEFVTHGTSEVAPWVSPHLTISNSGDIPSEAPTHIQNLFWVQDGKTYTSKVMTHNEWAKISIKDTVGIPLRHYIQKTKTGVKIYFDKTPQAGLVLHIIAKFPYTGTTSEGAGFRAIDDVTFEVGYRKMLKLRLAVELASSYQISPSQDLIFRAQEAEGILKTANYQPSTLESPVKTRRRVM